jgi:hypothetical protein
VHHAPKKMKFQNIGQKIKEELIGQRDELTQIDTGDFTKQKFDQVIIRNSISAYVFYIFLAIGLAVFFLLPGETGEMNIMELHEINWFWATIIGLLPLTLLYFSIRSLLDRTPKLTVDLNGIKTSDWEVTWHDIVETKFRFLKGKTTLLIIKTKNDEKTVDIGNTNVGPRFLGHHIELLKGRAG